MARILTAGLPADLNADLAGWLSHSQVLELPRPDRAPEAGHHEPADLLVVDDRFQGAHTPDWLAGYRRDVKPRAAAEEASSPSAASPVIYCLPPDADARLVRRLILELGVSELLFHPVEAGTLAERAASLLGLPCGPPPVAASSAPPAGDSGAELQRKLQAVWRRVSSRMFLRLTVLEQAGNALHEGRLGPDLRLQAEREAHKLAGSLGTFGLAAGSRFARELEHWLGNRSLEGEGPARRFSELLAALRLELDGAAASAESAQSPVEAHRRDSALLVTGDSELAARLREEAAAREWTWEAVPDATSARALVRGGVQPLSVVVIDLETAGDAEETLDFLSELTASRPATAAVVLTARGALSDRVEVSRRGGRGFFPKSLPPAEIVESALGLLGRLESASSRVLAVDDDLVILETLQALLAPHGIQLTGLFDPLRFWEALEGAPPDLVLLDVEMPSVGGLELCRALRSDPRWAGIPVIFLTAHSDAATVNRVFSAGADDFVAKPIVGPELATRIANRLERTRLLRHLAETDPVTSLPNRLKSTRALQDFLRLADRHAQPLGFAALEVDGLKQLNEAHGAAAGDEALRWLGERLRRSFRSEEITARWGGNDFVAGLYGLDREGSVRRLQGVIRDLAARSIGVTPGGELRLTLSAGVAGYPEDAHDLEGLRQVAVEARRRAAAAGGNRVLAGSVAGTGDALRRADVAVVTGDEASAVLLVHAFESVGLRARALRNGLVAARTLCGPDRSLKVRALVLDLDLPGLDGLTLLRQLASEGILRDSPAILLTSPSVGLESMMAMELGAEDHVAKPFNVPVLVERVRQLLSFRVSRAHVPPGCLQFDADRSIGRSK